MVVTTFIQLKITPLWANTRSVATYKPVYITCTCQECQSFPALAQQQTKGGPPRTHWIFRVDAFCFEECWPPAGNCKHPCVGFCVINNLLWVFSLNRTFLKISLLSPVHSHSHTHTHTLLLPGKQTDHHPQGDRHMNRGTESHSHAQPITDYWLPPRQL